MALSAELLQFQSSGIYSLEFDKSQTVNIPAETIRLVVGFSKKGPFNTPLLIKDSSFFQDVYGQIDRGLERKESYFHRSALTALESGPILALNLLRLNDDKNSPSVDLIDYQAFSAASTVENPLEKFELYSGFYNKSKFYYPDTVSMLDTLDNNAELFQLVNLKQKPITVIVKKSTKPGFNVTAREWYGAEDVPSFMNPFDYINDYMIQVIVLDGDYNNFEQLSIDPLFGDYFDSSKGVIKSKMQEFLNLPQVSVIGAYDGIIIPDFIDKEGNNLFIQDIINFETSKTGLFCSIKKELFDLDEVISGVKYINYDGKNYAGIDLVGHNLEYNINNDPNFNRINFLSYDRLIKDDIEYTESDTTPIELDFVALDNNINFDLVPSITGGATTTPPTSVAIAPGSGITNYQIIIESAGPNAHPQYDSIKDKLFINTPGITDRTVGSYVLVTDGTETKYAPIVLLQEISNKLYIGLSIEEDGWEIDLSGDKLTFISATDFAKRSNSNIIGFDGINHGIYAAMYNSIYDDFDKGLTTTGDITVDSSDTRYFLKFNKSQVDMINTTLVISSYYKIPVVLIKGYASENLQTIEDLPAIVTGNYKYANGDVSTDDIFVTQSLAGTLNSVMEVIDIVNNSSVTLDALTYENSLSVGDYLVADEIGPNGESRLTKINRIARSGNIITVSTDTKIKLTSLGTGYTVERYKEIETIIEHYKTFKLNGFVINPDYHMPNGSQQRLDDILDETIGSDSNLFRALIDKNSITYRYIVDTFGLGISTESKYQLSKLAKYRKNALGILNAPSMKTFKKSTDPVFVNAKGILDTYLISTGGDLTKNPGLVYGLPSIQNGANYSTFYTPFLSVMDRGKTIQVPPAAFVSNNYIAKYRNALPWSIVAGPRRGVVSGRGLKGLELNFDRQDRDYLEPFGLNPIIFQRGVGIEIVGNKTAQQKITSALSSAHVREVLIYIEDGIAEILKMYHFEFNTNQTRLEVKTLADNFCASIKADNGVYDYKNIMDTSNNNKDVLGANMGIIDTYVEPVKGLEILVHRTTILETGAIKTGQYL